MVIRGIGGGHGGRNMVDMYSCNCVGGPPAGNPTYPQLNNGIAMKQSPHYQCNLVAVAPW